MEEIIKVKNLAQTKRLAKKLSKSLKGGETVLLYGDLGAGKTTFTQFFAKALGVKDVVTSPTFNIVKEYPLKDFSIYHFDLYRLKNKNELYELDIENSFENGISIIEWPEIADNIIYNIAVDIEIVILQDNSRIFNVKFA